jgi:hypothetical protein
MYGEQIAAANGPLPTRIELLDNDDRNDFGLG